LFAVFVNKRKVSDIEFKFALRVAPEDHASELIDANSGQTSFHFEAKNILFVSY
jgi:hypothetical protein